MKWKQEFRKLVTDAHTHTHMEGWPPLKYTLLARIMLCFNHHANWLTICLHIWEHVDADLQSSCNEIGPMPRNVTYKVP